MTSVNEVRTTLRDDLIAARALIDTPEKWGKGRNRKALSDGSYCYCTAGALWFGLSYDADRASKCEDALIAALPHARFAGIRTYNDDPRTAHADIMALFDRAIASAESSS